MLADLLSRVIAAITATDSSVGTFARRRRAAPALASPSAFPRFNSSSTGVQALRGLEKLPSLPSDLELQPYPISLLSSAGELFRFAHAGREVEYDLSRTGEVGVLSAAWSTADDAPVKIIVDSSLCEEDSVLKLDSVPDHGPVLLVGEGATRARRADLRVHSLRD